MSDIQSVKYVKDLIDTSKNAYMLMTLTDGKIWSVPIAEKNRFYQDIQEWVADGNTIEEAD
jgi:hypothetical protein